LAFDFVLFRREGGAARGDDLVEDFEVGNVLVDDGLVDERPEGLGGLHLRGVGRLEDQTEPLWHDKAGFAVPAGIVEHKDDDPFAPAAPASSANRRSNASKKGLETPFETYQKTSPVAGETKAVT